eukprot:COSAG05_NODE_1353_length_5111_cov_5.861931_4_plen_174_part_00
MEPTRAAAACLGETCCQRAVLPPSCLALGWPVSPQLGVPGAAATVLELEPELEPELLELVLAQELVPEPELEPELDQELVLAQALEQVLVAVRVEPPPTVVASHGPQSPCIQHRPSSRMPQHHRHPRPKRRLNSSHHHKDQADHGSKLKRWSTCYEKTYTTALCQGSSRLRAE